MNLSLGERPVRLVYPTMAPLAASFASLRRMECSTSNAGERLKCVRPSLSNSATSLTCMVVAIGKILLGRAQNGLSSKNVLFCLKSDRLAKESDTFRAAKRYCWTAVWMQRALRKDARE